MSMCWSIRRVLAPYDDGALGQRRAQRVTRHLRTCPACQRELLELQRMTRLLHCLPAPSRPPAYWPGMFLQLQSKIQQQSNAAGRSAWLDYLTWSSANPAQALVPVALVSMALFATVTFLGLEDV